MGFILPNGTISYTATKLLPKQKYPIDLRLVVQAMGDLTDLSLWFDSVSEIDKRYSGMIVSVVDDPNGNNGVYSLRKYQDRNFMKSVAHPGGWFKVGEDSQVQQVTVDGYTIKDGPPSVVANINDTAVDGLHVVRVDGGEY